jgi:hypothetical protein
MATHEFSIRGNTVPDSSGNVWEEPYSILATNDIWPFSVIRFGTSNSAEPTARNGIHGQFTVPRNYVAAPKVIIVWTATATTGNVAWDVDYRTVGGDDTTSLDQTGNEQSATVTDAAPGAANRRLRAEIALTAANFSTGETVEFFFCRDGADAADTMAASALLIDLLFEYSDV